MNFGIMFENAQLGDNIGYTGFLNPGFYIEQYLNSKHGRRRKLQR